MELLDEIEKETEDVVTTSLQNELNQCYQATLTNRRVVPFLDNKRRGKLMFISRNTVFAHLLCFYALYCKELLTFVFVDFNPVFSHVFGIRPFVRCPEIICEMEKHEVYLFSSLFREKQTVRRVQSSCIESSFLERKALREWRQ